LDLPAGDREGWIEARSWTSDALALGERLLSESDRLPLVARLPLARLAARVTIRTPLAPGDALFKARVDDVLGRASLLEVRALRRRGQIEEARERFAELEGIFAADPGVLYFWLTLAGERDLTLGLLLRDEGRLTLAAVALHRAETVAGPAERVRAEGFLLGCLRAALVTCRAELARRRREAARKALAAGVRERFSDLPDVASVRTVLAAVTEHAAGPLDFAFLQRLDLWLILAEDSPGVGLPD
jgi:hypothetical protein